MSTKKQEDIYGLQVPALYNVGVAWVNHFYDIMLYVSKAASRSFLWIPNDTLINKYYGLSTIFPWIFNKYDFSNVLKPK